MAKNHALAPPGHATAPEQLQQRVAAHSPLRLFLDQSSDAAIAVDAQGRWVAANAAAGELLGYHEEDWGAVAIADIFVRGAIDSAAGWPKSGSAWARRKDGAAVRIELWSTGLTGFDGAASLLYVRGVDGGVDVGRGGEAVDSDSAADKAVVGVSLDGTVTDWNQAAEQLYGFGAAEMVGRSIAKLAPTESLEDVVSLLQQIRHGDRTVSFHTSQMTKEGCRVDVCLDIAPVRNDTGDVASGMLVVRDVIGRPRSELELRRARASAKDANRALRESEERFRGAFDGASIGMALVSPTGRFLLVNPALRGILRYEGNELLTLSFREITHPEDRDKDRDQARRLLAGEIDTYQIEKRYIRKDGETIWGRLTVSLAPEGSPAPRYIVAQVQDITPYKAAGAALREAEARYRTLVEQIPAAVYVDAGEALGTPRYISPRIEAMLGYSPREWVDDPGLWIRAIHPEDRERILAAIAAADGAAEPMHLEYRFLARDGRQVWVHDQVGLVRDENGAPRYWQGFMVDITDRKRAEEELLLAKEAAEEANRLKSAFLSMATHELRTPLTIMSGYVEMLAESMTGRLTPEEQEFLDVAQTGTRTLAALVDDLLDLARMEAGRLDLSIRAVDVSEAIERVHRLVAAQAASKGIALNVAAAPGLPPVAADLDRLVQVLFNLLGNAIKFTERGSVRLTVSAAEGGVAFRVADTGVGIPPDALPRIFDEFRQADAGTTRKFGGSGLGLAIAKRLVEMQGGAIAVESAAGVGSEFTVWLPAAEDEPAEVQQPTAAPRPDVVCPAGRR